MTKTREEAVDRLLNASLTLVLHRSMEVIINTVIATPKMQAALSAFVVGVGVCGRVDVCVCVWWGVFVLGCVGCLCWGVLGAGAYIQGVLGVRRTLSARERNA